MPSLPIRAWPVKAGKRMAEARADLADGLSAEERALLGEALSALRRERGKAWNAACDQAEAQGKRCPPLRAYGIDDIQRLARRFGTKALHWTDR